MDYPVSEKTNKKYIVGVDPWVDSGEAVNTADRKAPERVATFNGEIISARLQELEAQERLANSLTNKVIENFKKEVEDLKDQLSKEHDKVDAVWNYHIKALGKKHIRINQLEQEKALLIDELEAARKIL